MAAKKTPQTQSKSAFIRSQPATLSATEVVEKAKAAGVTIKPGLVYEVRRMSKQKKRAAKNILTGHPSDAKKSTVSKADFVRAHRDLSPKELVAKAKVEGVTLDASYVYNVRGADRTMAKKKRMRAKTETARNGASVPRSITTTSKAEDLLKAVAAEIGLGRAMEILAGERARVRAVIGG